MRGQLAGAAVHRGVLPEGLVQRRLVDADVAQLGRLMADGYRGTADDTGEHDAWHQAEAEATIQGTYGAVLWDASQVAVEGSQLAGTCLVTDEGPHLLLAFALVLPEWRNRGVGTALIAASARALLSASYTEWTLAVTEDNPALGLYERLGFVPDESLRRSRKRR
jgi:GNAT superfamily N-acetyltransferase